MKEYFSHDYGSRNDRKITKLVMKHGMQGIGIFWCIVEMLYEEGGYLPLEYERITYELRTEYELVKSVIHDFELFEIDNEKFWSESIIERLNARAEKSEKARQSINKRWEKYKDTNVIRTYNEGNTIKVKESKGNQSKINISFDVFWNLYDKKVGAKDKCEKKWNNLNNDEREKIINTLPTWKSKIADKQFQPFPETYLNQKRWNDEIKQRPKLAM